MDEINELFVKVDEIIQLMMDDKADYLESLNRLKEERIKLFQLVEEILEDKQKDIDALILVNNVLSTESNYYKTHWFSNLFNETSDWLKDLIINVVEKNTPEPLNRLLQIPALKEQMFNLVFKIVSLRLTSIIIIFFQFLLTYRSIRIIELFIYNFCFFIFGIHYINYIFKVNMVCYIL